MTQHILIIGAGICGLATALGLANQGFQVSIAEQATQFEEIGAGLQLSPNAIAALKYLDAYDEVLEAATVIDTIIVYSDNKYLTSLNTNALAKNYNAPFLSLHRASLHGALLKRVQELPNITIYVAHVLKNVETFGDTVSAEFENGVKLVADVLIGADGVKSKTRQIIMNIAAVPSGYTAKRALVENANPHLTCSKSVELFLSPHSHGVTYPLLLQNKRNYIWTVCDEDSNNSSNIDGSKNWLNWPMFTVPTLTTWHVGNVLLVGDAAHGMLPFASQGACMALEDAAVLAKLCKNLPKNTSIQSIFTQFEQMRKPRTTAAQKLSLKNGANYHASGALALARNFVLKYFGAPLIALRMSWVWRWTI